MVQVEPLFFYISLYFSNLANERTKGDFRVLIQKKESFLSITQNFVHMHLLNRVGCMTRNKDFLTQ